MDWNYYIKLSYEVMGYQGALLAQHTELCADHARIATPNLASSPLNSGQLAVLSHRLYLLGMMLLLHPGGESFMIIIPLSQKNKKKKNIPKCVIFIPFILSVSNPSRSVYKLSHNQYDNC